MDLSRLLAAISQGCVEYFASRSAAMPNGCIEWTGPLKGAGYGQSATRFGGGRYAHRVVYEQAHGPIPAGMCVCHRCDNKKCLNLAHLFLGTHRENMKDMHAKNRQRGGSLPNEKNPHCRIKDAEVIAIRKAYEGGMSFRALSESFGVDRAHCRRIVMGESRTGAQL